MITKRFSMVLVFILLVIFSVLSVASALKESLTYDEIVAVEVGNDAWHRHDFSRDTNVPPLLREIAVVPSLLGITNQSPYPNIREFPARMVTIALGVMLGFAIYSIAQSYFGREAGLLALFFYVFEPNILANSHYITQDIGATLLFFLACISLVKIYEKPHVRLFILLGVISGLMAASKITVVFYFLISALGITAFQFNKNVETLRKYKIYAVFAVVIALFIIWSTYFFKTNVIVAPGGNTERVSAKLMNWATRSNNQIAQGVLRGLHTAQVPLGDYIATVKNALLRLTKPEQAFFLGTLYANVRWYFMAVNALLKTPLPLLFIFLLGLMQLYQNKKLKPVMAIFFIPVISVLLITSVTKMQPLVRYMLPMYPFIILIASSVMQENLGKYKKIFLFFLCLWYVWGSVSSFPHFIRYANELAGPKKISAMKFIDSNVDWGQSLISFKKYIDTTRPSAIRFSYFGRDDASAYGFPSHFPYGSYKFNEICAFHDINYPSNTGQTITAISLSNWYGCGYHLDPQFKKNILKAIISDSILIFN